MTEVSLQAHHKESLEYDELSKAPSAKPGRRRPMGLPVTAAIGLKPQALVTSQHCNEVPYTAAPLGALFGGSCFGGCMTRPSPLPSPLGSCSDETRLKLGKRGKIYTGKKR